MAKFEGKFQGKGSSTNDCCRQKTRVPGLSRDVVCLILRLAVLIQYRHVTDIRNLASSHPYAATNEWRASSGNSELAASSRSGSSAVGASVENYLNVFLFSCSWLWISAGGTDVVFNKFGLNDASSRSGNASEPPNSEHNCVVTANGLWKLSSCDERHVVVCQSDQQLPGTETACSHLLLKQKAYMSQRDRATHCVSKFVLCFTRYGS